MPDEWSIRKVSIESSSPASSSGMRSAIDLLRGLRLSSTPTSPNWNEPSISATRLPSSVAAATARLTATVVRPTPPLGLKTRDDQARFAITAAATRADAPVGRAAGRGHRRDGEPALLVTFPCAHLPDRGGELVAAEWLDQELARAGQHRAAQVVGFALDRHHDHRGARSGRGHLFRGGDAVHVRHVDVHQDDIRVQPNGHLEGLATGRRRADHVDVALEAQELREVIAGLGDVVDDEDADLIGHLWWEVLVSRCGEDGTAVTGEGDGRSLGVRRAVVLEPLPERSPAGPASRSSAAGLHTG